MDASFYCRCQFVACKSIANVPESLTTATSLPLHRLGRNQIPICRGGGFGSRYSAFSPLQKPEPALFRMVAGVF